MSSYSPAWPHSAIKEIFPDIFFVMGMNKTRFNNVELQHSRNMTIVRSGNQLTLINTVRLDEDGLAALDKLGKVENIVRIGAFHGRDDAFYLDRYQGRLWEMKGMEHTNARKTDIELTPDGEMPFPNSSFFRFETSKFPEGIIHVGVEGGILVSCDSIKNWVSADSFFSEETARLYQAQGFFGPASISSIWKQATDVQASDFEKLLLLPFRHLISAHGEPLLNVAHESLENAVRTIFAI